MQALTKIARVGSPPVDPNFPGDATNPEALKQVALLGLAAFGGSAGVRSLVGLKDMFAKAIAKRRPVMHPAVIEANVPEVQEEDENGLMRLRPPGLSSKYASTTPTWLDYFMGRRHTDLLSKPWVIPAGLAASTAGIVGGWKGVGNVLENAKKNEKEQELENVKEEYRKALVEQYTPDSPAIKRAGSKLGEDLDELYELCKTAEGSWLNPLDYIPGHDMRGKLSGGAIALAGLLATGTGLATYSWAKGRTPEERMAKAIKQRERLRWATRPPEIYAITRPQPVRLSKDQNETEYSAPTHDAENTFREYTKTSRDTASEIGSLYKP